MVILKRNIHSIFIFTVFFTLPVFCGNHTISTSFEVSEAAINSYLQKQYTMADFPRNFTVSGTNYQVFLSLPEIILTSGNAKLKMTFDVKNGSTLLYHFVIQPSVNIPNSQISLSEINAFITNLQQSLDAVTPILPQWVKTNIISKYNLIGWLTYPSKLLDEFNDNWFAQQGLAIEIIDISMGINIIQDRIKFNVSVDLSAHPPVFRVYFGYDANSNRVLYIRSENINMILEKVDIKYENDDILQTWSNVSCVKGDNALPINFVPIQIYIVDLIINHNNTFKIRRYLLHPTDYLLGTLRESLN
ncbi:MAG: hypothetical protein GXX85_15350 [Ignavibacteria bacterium]|nr:hypothetical protein [Ignavibacteria bacterium]